MTGLRLPRDLPLCESCRSTWIYARPSDGLWKCRSCEHTFRTPLYAADIKRTNGSGQIAALSYRAQLARDALARGAPECIVVAKFNPRGE